MPDYITLPDRIRAAYSARACFVCGLFGACKHREYKVEEAYLEADSNRYQIQSPAPIKPIQRARESQPVKPKRTA